MNTPPSPPLPVSYHPAGRYLLPVPQGMKYAGMYHTINYIHVEETPWERGDRAGQFQELWSEVLETATDKYNRRASLGPSSQGGLAHEDVSKLFGHEAVLLCYANDQGGHNIDVFIALPEHILRITEDCGYDVGEECTDMTDYILDFYRHYRPNWKNCSPDSFLTPRGRLEGLEIVDEYVSASSYRPAAEEQLEIVLSMSESYLTRPPGERLSISVFRKALKAHGIELEVVRSRQRTVASIPGRETAFIMSENKNGKVDAQFSAEWASESEANNLDRPRIHIEINCDASAENEALHLWDTVMDSFTSVRNWHESKMKRR